MSKIGWRTWILIILLVSSLWLIRPTFETGVEVKSIDEEGSLYLEGLRQGEIIKSLNGEEVKDIGDYSRIVEAHFADGVEKRFEVTTDDGSYIVLESEIPDISVGDVPGSRIQTGLDLRGGARALVQADQPLTDEQMDELISVASNRFNVFGITDVQVRGISDLAGNQFMLVEVAGATPADLEDLIGQQGKFEGRIGNITVFDGDRGDIADVCRNDATCSGVTSCFPSAGGYACTFQFTLFLTAEAAEGHADVTRDIPLEPTGRYLTENLDLLIDGEEVSSLRIGSSLKGEVTTQISIQGSGSGVTQNEAILDARDNMKGLQTILITGSLPYELEIVKLDTISPSLGEEFTQIILLAGLAAIVVVALIVFVRYRNFKASLALLFTAFSEVILILGFAAMIRWNLDLPSIAGILATIGTGVDSQIIILDEARKRTTTDVKNRIKRALFIIMAVYFTSLASLIPLYWAGAGLFKGFAVTTIIGITAGVFVTRPAFGEIVGKLIKKKEEESQ